MTLYYILHLIFSAGINFNSMEFPGTESFRTIDHKRFLAFIWNLWEIFNKCQQWLYAESCL